MSDLLACRDDGPLARALGRAGRAFPLAPAALIVLGLIPLLVAIAATGASASDGLAAEAIGWFVLTGGISGGRPHHDRLRWAVPGLLRIGEYAAIVWVGALAGRAGPPAAFALLIVVAYHQYDLVYRPRYRGSVPPAWLRAVTLGWDGRLVLAWALLAVAALPAAMYATAAALAVVLIGETVAAWARFGRAAAPVPYDDEEGAA